MENKTRKRIPREAHQAPPLWKAFIIAVHNFKTFFTFTKGKKS